MDHNSLYAEMAGNPESIRHLYRYGYFITSRQSICHPGLSPILETWSWQSHCGLQFWVHPDQSVFFHQADDALLFLIGHCYDPFSMVHSEPRILEKLAVSLACSTAAYCEALSDLTGVFLTGYVQSGAVHLFGDAAGMLMTYYGYAGGDLWISSHAALIGDLNGLSQSDYVQRLTRYRFYPLFGFALPGDCSPYAEFRRLVPNHTVCLQSGVSSVRRFYPTEDWASLCNAHSLQERAAIARDILGRTMTLIPMKWHRPAISMTGGCDSKTTLACAKGAYEQYRYFSYRSSEAEALDAEGAAIICGNLNLPHTTYNIPEHAQADHDAELAQNIIRLSMGDIGTLSRRETEKRIFLSGLDHCDVEVKSWASEIARAYYHKRFAKSSFPAKPTARYATTLYKVFAHNRKLVRETDRIFEAYLQTYLNEETLCGWSWLDLFFWEYRVSAWNGLVITGEHRYSGEITIPYNNRRLLTLMMAVPEDVRISDELYRAIRAVANPDVDAAGVQITNLKHTTTRAKMERIYLTLHTRFPF